MATQAFSTAIDSSFPIVHTAPPPRPTPPLLLPLPLRPRPLPLRVIGVNESLYRHRLLGLPLPQTHTHMLEFETIKISQRWGGLYVGSSGIRTRIVRIHVGPVNPIRRLGTTHSPLIGEPTTKQGAYVETFGMADPMFGMRGKTTPLLGWWGRGT